VGTGGQASLGGCACLPTGTHTLLSGGDLSPPPEDRFVLSATA